MQKRQISTFLYRKLNEVTRKDYYLLPRVDDTQDTLAGSQWFVPLIS